MCFFLGSKTRLHLFVYLLQKVVCWFVCWQSDDRMALVGKDEVDVELGNSAERHSLPPQW